MKYIHLLSFSLCTLFTFSNISAQVGIGTTAPESTLDIRAEDHEGIVSSLDGLLVPRVSNLSVSGQTDGQLIYLIADNGSFTKGFHYWDTAAAAWTPIDSTIEPWYRAGTTEPATSNTDNIYSLGQVGIGTTNPLGALHVTTENSRDVLFFRFIDGGSDDLDLDLFRSEGTLGSPSLLQDNTRIGGLRGQSIINAGAYTFRPSAEIYFQADGASSSSSSSGKIKFATTPSGTTSTVDRMTIRANGNIGIGTTDPQELLHIDGGTLRLTDGNEAAGRVLTSDANGTATWEIPGANQANWALTGNAVSTGDFLGTTNSQPLNFRVDNLNVGSIKPDNSFHIGNSAASSGLRSMALGNQAIASGDESVALGRNTTASGQRSTSIGFESTSVGDESVALGRNAASSGQRSTAVGLETTAQGAESAAFGRNASATGDRSTAIGFETTASSGDATAVGRNADASALRSTAIGFNAIASGNDSGALGRDAQANGSATLALGPNATAADVQSIAIGSSSNASFREGIAIGSGASIGGQYSTALGRNATTFSSYGLAVGYNTRATNPNGSAIGISAISSNSAAIAIGSAVSASGLQSIAIGDSASSTGSSSVALGPSSRAQASSASALGYQSVASASRATAIGFEAAATQSNTIILGNSVARVGVGTSTPDTSSILDLTSTNKGVLVPRVTLSATNSASPVTNPATGLMVFNTTSTGTFPNNVTVGFYFWDGARWRSIADTPVNRTTKFTNNTTNLDFSSNSGNGVGVTVDIFGAQQWNEDTSIFTKLNNTDLQILEPGYYEITTNLYLETDDIERYLKFRLRLNNTDTGDVIQAIGPEDGGSDETFSVNFTQTLFIDRNDILRLRSYRVGSNATINFTSNGTSSITVKKLR